MECKIGYNIYTIRHGGEKMEHNYTRIEFEKVIRVDAIITLFYMELSKSFCYEGERHNFWEMVYIDKGEMICTADKNRFVLKSGEMTFHQPNEFHNLSGNNAVAPNISIVTFACDSPAMEYFSGKIFRLTAEEKSLLSMLFSEGLSCYRLEDQNDPLLQRMYALKDAPFGSSQMTKNLLEAFLIRLHRNKQVLTKSMRQSFVIDGVDVPGPVKAILDYLSENIYNKLTVADVAKRMGKSESGVKQLFATYRKDGIIAYYNERKIQEAKRLIREGMYNMTQISDLLHFSNPQYFSRCFKTITHMTPSQYKASILR